MKSFFYFVMVNLLMLTDEVNIYTLHICVQGLLLIICYFLTFSETFCLYFSSVVVLSLAVVIDIRDKFCKRCVVLCFWKLAVFCVLEIITYKCMFLFGRTNCILNFLWICWTGSAKWIVELWCSMVIPHVTGVIVIIMCIQY